MSKQSAPVRRNGGVLSGNAGLSLRNELAVLFARPAAGLACLALMLAACGGGGGSGGSGSEAGVTAAAVSGPDCGGGTIPADDVATTDFGAKKTLDGQFPAEANTGEGAPGKAVIAMYDGRWDDPITITRGGTYTGNWRSDNAAGAAVTIKTTEPVVIENANMRSKGDLIFASVAGGANVTVRNSRGWALNPDVAGRAPGRFLRVTGASAVVVENNYMEGTAGIRISCFVGARDGTQSVRVRFNRARNIDGRCSNGAGGFTTEQNCESGFAQFIQLVDVRRVPGVEIAWNEVVNVAEQSRPEDLVSVYKSSGTAGKPLRVHNNFVQGAYPANAASAQAGAFTGGGFMLGDGSPASAIEAPGYVDAYDNQVVGTTNHGIFVSAGHDIHFYRNRVIISGRLPDADGTYVPATFAGVASIKDYYLTKVRGWFANNWAQDNEWAGVRQNPKGDYYRRDLEETELVDCQPGQCKGNASIDPDNLDLRALEAAERERWNTKVIAGGVTIGPK